MTQDSADYDGSVAEFRAAAITYKRQFVFVLFYLSPEHARFEASHFGRHASSCFVRMCTCMYVCLYGCMYVCMYACVFIYLHCRILDFFGLNPNSDTTLQLINADTKSKYVELVVIP